MSRAFLNPQDTYKASPSRTSASPLQSQGSGRSAAPPRNNLRSWRIAALLYAILVVYGSLYPLTGWTLPHEPLFSFLTAPAPAHDSRADIFTNVLAYIPLGALLVWSFPATASAVVVMLVTLAGTMLSFVMESVQMFLPSRTSSKIDLLTNILGTLAGAIAGSALRHNSVASLHIRTVRDTWFEKQEGVNIGLCAVLLWMLSQLCPFVPSMDVSSVREGLAPLWHTLNDPSSLSRPEATVYGLNIAGLGLLLTVVARQGKKAALAFWMVAGLTICVKPLIVSRQVSLEAVSGWFAAGVVLMVTPKAKGLRALLAMLCIFVALAMGEIIPSVGGFHAFNWVPFAGQVDNTVRGFGSILEAVWPFTALSALTILGFGAKWRPMLVIGGLLLVLVFGFEWAQQGIVGRYGDITAVMLAGVGWASPWAYVVMGRDLSPGERVPSGRRVS